jgi:hypothetical protein
MNKYTSLSDGIDLHFRPSDGIFKLPGATFLLGTVKGEQRRRLINAATRADTLEQLAPWLLQPSLSGIEQTHFEWIHPKNMGGKYNLHAYPIDISFPSHGENYGRIQPPRSERPNASAPNTDNPLQAEAAERLKGLLAEAHLQGGGHENPVDFSSLDSISRIYGGKIKVPSQSLIIPGSPEGTLGVSGALGVTFMGKQPHEFTPAEWGHFGEEHGVPSLGPKDTAKWQSGLQKIKTLSGREMTVPGGIDNPEPFSYYDLLPPSEGDDHG